MSFEIVINMLEISNWIHFNGIKIILICMGEIFSGKVYEEFFLNKSKSDLNIL